MTDDWQAKDVRDSAEDHCDPELTSVLHEWKAPDIPASLDARVLDSYRRQMTREPLWRRFFTTSVRVPLPVAVAAMTLLVVALGVAVSRPAVVPPQPGQYVQAPADQPMVVRTSLAGFEPVEEVNVSVVTEQLQ